MKRILLILLLTGVVPYLIQAQDNASAMKLIYNADGSISPPYLPPLGAVEPKILELADGSVQLFNITLNQWGGYHSWTYSHVTKFRFIDTSDIGIDSGLVLSTGRSHSDSVY